MTEPEIEFHPVAKTADLDGDVQISMAREKSPCCSRTVAA